MAKPPLELSFPVGGVNKRYSIQRQAPYTSPNALNYWPVQWSSGRGRGGTRLGITAFDNIGSAPRNWCPVSWVNSTTTYRGVAVACAGGVYVSTGGSFTAAISTGASSDFTSCAIFNNVLIQARFGQLAKFRTLTTPGTGGGTDLDAAASTGQIAGSDGGTPPADCGLVCVHNNRVLLAGSQAAPHAYYMSRAGYHLDWDYAQTDQGGAFASSGGESGKIGEPITALIPHTHSCTLIGCTDSMYVIKGNPRGGGSVYMVSPTVGPVMQSAWAQTENGWTYFLSRNGLYRIPPGCPDAAPELVSREYLPEELAGIDPAGGDYCSVGFDSRWRGLHIYIDKASGSDIHYFFDLQQDGGFWPMSFASTMRLAVNHKSISSATKSSMLAITASGQSYQFDTASTESIASHLAYGPFMLGQSGAEGIISECVAILAENSSNVSWKLYCADSAQQAYSKLIADTPSFTGTAWTIQGRSYVQNPNVRGTHACLKIYATGTNRISVESVELRFRNAGLARVG